MGNWRMNNRMNFFKRLTALLLAMLLFTTMMGDDFFSLADEEIAVESVESEPAQAAPESGGASEAVASEAAPVETAPAETASADAAVPTETTTPTETPAAETPATTVEGNVPAEGAVSDVPATEGAATTTDGQTTVDTPADTPADTPTTEHGEGQTGENTNPTETETQSPEDSVSENNANDPANPEVIDSETEKATTEEVTEEKTTEEKTEEELTEEELLEKEKLEKEQLEKELEEKKKAEEEECEHSYVYIPNGDGSHTIKCEKCGEEETTEACTYENGVCIHCGYVNEEEKECEHEYEYISNDDGTHIKRCVKCGEETIEACEFDDNWVCIHCGYEDMSLVYQSYSQVVHGINVTVSGVMPRNAKVTAYYRGTKSIENIVNNNLDEGTFKAYAAFDINIYDRKGEKYQPVDDNNSVSVTFEGVNELAETSDEIVVYRVEDNNTVTEINSNTNGDNVNFEAEHFTVYAAGAYSTDTYIEFASYEYFGTYMSPTAPYTKVLYATFDLYVDDYEETYNFNAYVYKNSSTADLRSGTLIASGSESFSPTSNGWYTIQIPVTEITTGNGYVAAGQSYSIVVTSDTGVKVGYDQNDGIDCPTYKRNSDLISYTSTGYNRVFYLKTSDSTVISALASIKESTTIEDDPYEVTGIELSRAKNSEDKYIFALGESETLTAVLSESGVERTITWSTPTDSSVVTVSSTQSSTGKMTAKLTAVSTGETTVTATYNGHSATIKIVVIDLRIGGISATDSTGNNPVESSDSAFDYKGSKVDPTVSVINGNSDPYEIHTVYSDDVDAGVAKAEITFTSFGTNYVFERYYKINRVDITKTVNVDGNQNTAFTNGVYVIKNGTVTSVSNINASPSNPLGVTPVYSTDSSSTDFTIAVGTPAITNTGISYPLTITGVGNFTGTVSMNYAPSSINVDELFAAEINLNKTYDGLAVTDEAIWAATKIYDGAGNELSGIITSDNTTIEVSDSNASAGNERIDAGTKTVKYTVSSGSYTGSFESTFTIKQAELSSTAIIFNNGTGEFSHTGEEVKPIPGEDATLGYKVYLNYVDSDNPGVLISTDDYDYTWVGECTEISDSPKVKITSKGKNFEADSEQEKSYKIIPSFDLDLVVRITDGTNYDGKASNNYVTGYSRYYDGTKDEPTISVRLKNPLTLDTDYTYKVYDAYTNSSTYTELTPNVGTKYIVVKGKEGTSYAGKQIIATYEISKRPLTTNEITVVFEGDTSKTKVDDKTFTGVSQKLSVATDGNTDGKDIAIMYKSNCLVEGTDFQINYPSDTINAGEKQYTIEGINNFTGTISGTNYVYNITQATLGAEAIVTLDESKPYVYNGKPQRPSVKVTIGDPITFSETFKYDEDNPSVFETDNFKVEYTQNISPTTENKKAVITVTGKNNLKGSKTLQFDIVSNTDAFSAIYIGGTNPATFMREDSTTKVRYYECKTLQTTYTGSKYRGTPTVYHSNTSEPLTRGVDYDYKSYNLVNAYTETTYDDSAPRIEITGLGNYAGNNAVVYFNIQKADINNAQIDDFEASYEWAADTLVQPSTTIRYNNKELTSDKTDTTKLYGYSVKYYDSYDETTGEGTALTTTAGKKYAVFSGEGNFKNTVVKTYSVGKPFTNVSIVIKSGWYNETENPEILLEKKALKDIGDTPLDIVWRYSKAPIMNFLDEEGNAISSEAYNVSEPTSSLSLTGDKLYDAREQGNEDPVYNVLKYTVTPNRAGGYYGEDFDLYVRINPQTISTRNGRMSMTGTPKEQEYTGDDISVAPKFTFSYGDTSQNYILVGETDFKPTSVSIGTNVGNYTSAKVSGVGNFTGEQNLEFNILPGYLNLYVNSANDETKLGTTDSETNEYTIAGDNFPKYTYTGSEIEPAFVLTNQSDGVLTKESDYTVEYENNTNPTTDTSLAKATIKIKNDNFATKKIVVYFAILPNTLEGFTGLLGNNGSIDYSAVNLNPAEIKTQIETGDLSLVVSSGTKTLTYGTDYEIVVTNESTEASVLAAIREQEKYASETATHGANGAPSYETANWIYLKGLNTYSGYLKVNFSIKLDLGSVYANVTMPQRTYKLNADGTLAESLNPVIEYVPVGASSGYTETLSNKTTLEDGTTVYNYTVARDRNGLPGPDSSLSIVGQYACKGKATNLRYSDGTATGAVVCFLADLKNYGTADLTMSGGTVYPYTGEVVTVSFTGDILDGAVETTDVALEGDYIIEYYASPESAKSNAINVGKWYVVVRATDDSSYFIPNSKTDMGVFTFNIKYDLSTCTMHFENDAGVTIESISYNPGVPFDFATHAVIEYIKGDNKTIVYDPEVNGQGVGYIGFTPASVSKVTSNKQITAVPSPSPNEYCYGQCTANFSVTGLDINDCTITLSGTEFNYSGSSIQPTVTVTHNLNGTLRKDIDYKVTYDSDTTNAGTKNVIITGIGAYSNAVSKEYVIKPVTITESMISLAAPVYYAGPGVVVEPDIVITNGTDVLEKGTEYVVTNPDSNKTARTDAYVTISQGTSTNYLVPSPITYTFTINKLDLRLSDNVKISPDSAEFNGGTVDPYDVVTVALGDVELVSEKTDATNCDYTIKVYNAANTAETTLTKQGSYILRIYGAHNCDDTTYIEKDFTITARSLEDNYHYYYDDGASTGWKGTWHYDPDNARYECRGVKADGTSECLKIYVSDIVSLNDGDTPNVVVYDAGREDVTDSDGYRLGADDFTVTAYRNTGAASAEWSKTYTTDAKGGFHATVAATSPYIVITGKGDYTGSITLPFNIGKNLNTITDLSVVYTMTGADVTTYTYDQNKADEVAWSFNEYNGVAQKPNSITVKAGNTTLSKKSYTVSYTDGTGDEDSSIDAGYKYVVITGSGDYCGTIKQKYAINRKKITATGGPFVKDTMQTDGGELTFNVSGVAQPFTSTTATKYLVDTGLLTESQAANFVGYYYAIYDGEAVEPTITVRDNTLGTNKTTSKVIDAKELDIDFQNKEVVSTFDDGVLTTYSYATIKFEATGTNAGDLNKSGGNYYVPDEAVSYQINFIIVSHDISKDFSVRFLNGTDGNKYNYNSGKAITPEIEVTNGSRVLTEGEHYEISYGTKTVKTMAGGQEKNVTIPGNITPGETTLTVTGIGNYSGTKTLSFYIWGNLSQTDTYHIDENGNFVAGDIPVQQYTGTYITTGNPRVYLALPSQNDQEYDVLLTYDTEYYVQNYKSETSYVVDAWVEYAGKADAYWTGTKKIEYDIEYNEADIKATNYETTYKYTGHAIEPDFKINISTAEVGTVTYKRDGVDTTDLTSLGKITATIPYSIGTHTGSVTAEYEIVKRPISECKVVTTKTYTRYTGKAAKPAFTVYIESKNIKTGADQTPVTLTKDSDYTVDYGNYVYGDAQFTLTGISNEIYGTTTVGYTIKLQSVANLRVTENTGDSLTVEWVRDMYSEGTALTLQKRNDSGVFVDYLTTRAVGNKNTYKFTNLASSTEYQIIAKAYVDVSNTETIYSDAKSVTAITEIATSDINVVSTSAGRAVISWPTDGNVKLYYIYRAEDETSEGKVVAIIPASTGKYTNTKLTSGKTYYYHIDGYALVDGVLTKVNTSKHVAVTIK